MVRSIIAVLLLCFGASCGERVVEKPEAVSQQSVVENGIVENGFFKLAFTPPADWYLLSDEELRELLNFGENLAAVNNEDLNRLIEATRENRVAIFGIFRHPPGTPIDFNPNVIVQAERVAHAPGVKSGADYLFHTRQGLAQTGANAEVAEGYGSRLIGGVAFDQMNVTMTFQGNRVSQQFYATKYEDYILLIVVSGVDQSTDVILDAISLDWRQ